MEMERDGRLQNEVDHDARLPNMNTNQDKHLPDTEIYTTPDTVHDHITTLASTDRPVPAKPSYGIDSPLGLALSNIAAPLYLYASLKGKFELWDVLIGGLADETVRQPTLDVGCGRGLVLLKLAQRKQQLGASAKAYGIDLFIAGDQSGNAPAVTFDNAASLGVLDCTALLTASFAETLPFKANAFGVVTASLAVHNVDAEARERAIHEIARVCQPGGQVIMLDLTGYVKAYQAQLQAAGWTDVAVEFAGAKVMFGVWPCQVLKATKPKT